MRKSIPFALRFRISLAAAACLTVLAAGCATGGSVPRTDASARPASDVPDHFVVGSFTSSETAEPAAGEGCRSPLVDPRDGARLTLVRSAEDRGEYEVPAGRYGVGADELLRVECSSGRAIGIVRR